MRAPRLPLLLLGLALALHWLPLVEVLVIFDLSLPIPGAVAWSLLVLCAAVAVFDRIERAPVRRC